MEEPITSLDKLKKALEETRKKVEFIRSTPEYAEYQIWLAEHERFKKFIDDKRMRKTISIINSLIEDTYGVHEINGWLARLKKHNEKLSNNLFKRGIIHCESNVMQHVWDVFQKYGKEVILESMFGGEAYQLGNYTMQIYSGQGEYGYSIYTPKRIY